MPLKTLIVPAEIKSRELDSRILMGVIAAQKGWRVIIGSKSPLNRRVWKYSGDVYICQTLTKRRKNNLRLFRNLGLRSIGWDEEGLVYYGRDIYLSRRVSEDSLSLMEGLIAWGNVSKNDLEEKASKTGIDLRALGNPRMDLLRPELRDLFKGEAKKISHKYGNFVLINTNFPSVNPHGTVGDARSKVMQADKNARSDAAKRFSDMQLYRQKLLQEFFECLPQLAQAFPETNFIIRPHPAENIDAWQEACGSHENLIISQEGSVIPWLIAAKALLHNGCTTAIEYFLLGNSAIAYSPTGSRDDESPLPNGVSHHAKSASELSSFVRKSLEGKLTPQKSHRELMNEYLASQTGLLAAEQITEFCEEVLEKRNCVRGNLWSKTMTFLYCALRQIHRSTKMGDPARDYIAKVFPPTSSEYVQLRADDMQQLLDLPTPITVRECARNIFEMTPGQ